MILIYTDNITSRLEYITTLLFAEILKTPYSLTTDLTAFEKHTEAKISYSKNPVSGGISMDCVSLLFETKIHAQHVDKFEEKEYIALFSTREQKTDIHQDLFASAFYLVSRYEEYLNHPIDEHGRFSSGYSTAYTFGFIRKPMINYYAVFLQNKILEKYPNTVFEKNTFEFIPTFDIDYAYQYKGKGSFRNIGGALKHLFKLNFSEIKNRFLVLSGIKQDAYDLYSWIEITQRKYNVLKSIFFILISDFSKYDRPTRYKYKPFRTQIAKLIAENEVGIHPSYFSVDEPELLPKEKLRLEEIIQKPVTKSRNHFLRLKFPETYQRLIENGIQEDYTLTYASRPGFRASICMPFYFFDLSTNKKTTLKVFPVCFMDATFRYYKNYRSDRIKERLVELKKEVQKFDGTFVTLFHNSILASDRWKKIYEYLLNRIHEH